jgi:hypothetical protein
MPLPGRPPLPACTSLPLARRHRSPAHHHRPRRSDAGLTRWPRSSQPPVSSTPATLTARTSTATASTAGLTLSGSRSWSSLWCPTISLAPTSIVPCPQQLSTTTTIRTEQAPLAPSPPATGTTSSFVYRPGHWLLYLLAQSPPPPSTGPIATSSVLPAGNRVFEWDLLHLRLPLAPSTTQVTASSVYPVDRCLQCPPRQF